MKKILANTIIFAVGLTFGFAAFAATNKAYQLNMELSLNGKLVSAPQMIVKEGKMGTIIQGENFIDVTATDSNDSVHPGIQMTFAVGKIDAHGRKQVQARPRIISAENQKAEITQGDDSSSETMSLSVIANTTTM